MEVPVGQSTSFVAPQKVDAGQKPDAIMTESE